MKKQTKNNHFEKYLVMVLYFLVEYRGVLRKIQKYRLFTFENLFYVDKSSGIRLLIRILNLIKEKHVHIFLVIVIY